MSLLASVAVNAHCCCWSVNLPFKKNKTATTIQFSSLVIRSDPIRFSTHSVQAQSDMIQFSRIKVFHHVKVFRTESTVLFCFSVYWQVVFIVLAIVYCSCFFPWLTWYVVESVRRLSCAVICHSSILLLLTYLFRFVPDLEFLKRVQPQPAEMIFLVSSPVYRYYCSLACCVVVA